jgi:hypothetical protein
MKQRKHLLDYVIRCLQDGKSKRLRDIVSIVHDMGWKSSITSKYIHVYHELREHPELFKRVSRGHYRLKSKVKIRPLSGDQRINVVEDLLKEHPKQTVTQVWRAVQALGFTITYKSVQGILKSDLFTKDEFSRYSLDPQKD